jgi:hypothetical protein
LVDLEQDRHLLSLENQQIKIELSELKNEKATLLDYLEELQIAHEEKLRQMEKNKNAQEEQLRK